MPPKRPTIKQKDLSPDPLANTQQEPEKPAGDNNPVGVYLSLDEKKQLDTIADELRIKRHAVLQYAIRDFLRRWNAGEIELQTRKALPKL